MNRLRIPISALLLASFVAFGSSAMADVLTPSEVAQLRLSANRELVAVAAQTLDEAVTKRGGASAARTTLERADAEPDPRLREALLERWLRDWAPERGAAASTDPALFDRIDALTRFEPVVMIGHHEHPGRAVGAFNVAGQAGNRLHRIAVRDRADALVLRPETLEPLLTGSRPSGAPKSASVDVEAAVLALADLPAGQRDPIVTALRSRLVDTTSGTASWAGPALLELHELGALPDTGVLADLVRHAEAPVAATALRRTDHADDPMLKATAVRAALTRPGLGGLALARAAASPEPELAAAPWTLLDDPMLGGDAALALARHAPALEATIEVRYPDATRNERLRMQLALRLRDTPASRSLLDRLTAFATSETGPARPDAAREIER